MHAPRVHTCTKHSFSEVKGKKKKHPAFEHDAPDFLKDSVLNLVTETLCCGSSSFPALLSSNLYPSGAYGEESRNSHEGKNRSQKNCWAQNNLKLNQSPINSISQRNLAASLDKRSHTKIELLAFACTCNLHELSEKIKLRNSNEAT